MRSVLRSAGVVLLAAAWVGPLPRVSSHSFAAHMLLHIIVVAVAAPMLAYGMAGTRADPVRRAPQLFSPIPASMVELVVVWTWHAPLLHHAARVGLAAFVMEQASFLGAGLLLWLSVFGGGTAARAGAGVVALVFTAIHMTLLGALFALAPRPLYSHTLDAVATVQDQQIGGAVMIIVGGAAYLSGGLWLTRQLLERRVTAGLERLE
jgi:putative membrane protein